VILWILNSDCRRFFGFKVHAASLEMIRLKVVLLDICKKVVKYRYILRGQLSVD
jgi:hypothetical protein